METKKSEWKVVPESTVCINFWCSDCKDVVPVGPEDLGNSGAPMCCECDVEMEFHSVEVNVAAL